MNRALRPVFTRHPVELRTATMPDENTSGGLGEKLMLTLLLAGTCTQSVGATAPSPGTVVALNNIRKPAVCPVTTTEYKLPGTDFMMRPDVNVDVTAGMMPIAGVWLGCRITVCAEAIPDIRIEKNMISKARIMPPCTRPGWPLPARKMCRWHQN